MYNIMLILLLLLTWDYNLRSLVEVASALGQRQMDCDTQFGIILMGTFTDHKLINMLQKILNHNKHLW